MIRSYKFRLYPTQVQILKLENWSNACRAVYNVALQQRYEALQKQGKWISYYDQQKEFPELRKEFDWIKNISAGCLRDSTIRRLDIVFKRWSVQKVSKKPKFKKKNHGFYTLEYADNKKFKISNNKIQLEKLGKIKIRGDVKYFGKPKICRILKKANKYFASI